MNHDRGVGMQRRRVMMVRGGEDPCMNQVRVALLFSFP